jgi:hypothetical protein
VAQNGVEVDPAAWLGDASQASAAGSRAGTLYDLSSLAMS